jgi:hypothetical protein
MANTENNTSLDQEDRVVVGDTELKKYITNYYKNMFGQPDDTHLSMVETQRDDIPQVSENELLNADFFSEVEIKEAIFQIRSTIKHHDLMVSQQSFTMFAGKS